MEVWNLLKKDLNIRRKNEIINQLGSYGKSSQKLISRKCVVMNMKYILVVQENEYIVYIKIYI